MKNIDPSAVFSTIGNPVRLRCLSLVASAEDVCVCEVEAALQIAQPAASKALNALKASGLLEARREANWNYYSLREDLPPWLQEVIVCTVRETTNQEPYKSDQRRLASLKLRPSACA